MSLPKPFTDTIRKFNAKIYGTAIAVVAACCAVYACHSETASDDTLPPCVVTASLDSLFSNIFPGTNAPGGIVVVMRNDTTIYRHAFGMADLETHEPITDSTYFNLSSASKIFTSAALLKLHEQGKLSIDDSLSKFFPEFNSKVFDAITIRHILTHSSGLPDLRPRNQSEWSKYQDAHNTVYVFGQDYALYGDENEHMQAFQNLNETEYAPGEHYERQDPAYILVAPLIECVTGQKFERWMQENIFEPAGMTEVFYASCDYPLKRLAHAYRKAEGDAPSMAYRSKDGKWDEYDMGEAPYFLTRADRGIYSTARDFMKWNSALYSGKIISDSSLTMMNTPYVPTDIPMVSFGLGTALRIEPGYPMKSYHMNFNGGYSIAEGTWPEKQLHYVVFANRADWDTREITAAFDSIFLANNFTR